MSVSAKKIGLGRAEQNGKHALYFLRNIHMRVKKLARLEFLVSKQYICC